MNNNHKDRLEQIIDQVGLMRVLEDIGDICHGKASHIQSNWQDKELSEIAQLWAKAGGVVSGISTNRHVQNVSPKP